MKSAYKFDCEKRETLGRGAARELRRNKRIPAVLYSNKVKPVSFSVAENEFTKEYHKGAFRSKLIELAVGNETYYALAREIQAHPVSDKVEHIDFLQVDKDSTVSVAVPLKVVGAEKSIGIKMGGALNVVRHTVKMICTPENIPTSLSVDISEAGIGDSLHISSVDLPEGVRPEIQDRDFTIATIAGRLKKDEEVAVEAAEGEESAEGEEGTEEAAAEGDSE